MHKVLVAAFLPAFVCMAQEPAKTYENMDAVIWTQHAVEYRANAIQAYRAAKANLLRALEEKNWTAALEQSGNYRDLPPAVILDLDETVLNNSAMNARLVAKGEKYNNKAWQEWVAEKKAGS